MNKKELDRILLIRGAIQNLEYFRDEETRIIIHSRQYAGLDFFKDLKKEAASIIQLKKTAWLDVELNLLIVELKKLGYEYDKVEEEKTDEMFG